jgi:peptide/nickel transport system substrate-binding protein
MKPLSQSLAATLLVTTLMVIDRPFDALAAEPASVVTVATIGEPPTLDPVGVTSDLVSIISQHVFETLYTFDGKWALTPLLASALPTVSADGKSYTIPLRTDVVFHDGTKMTGDDVVASLDRWMKLSPRGKSAAGFIETITAKDGAVTITLKQPYAPLPALLAMNNGAAAIVPKSVISGVDPLKALIGTGPYKFLEHKPDQYIRLTRFDGYVPLKTEADGYGGARVAKIGEIRFVPVPNATTRAEGIVAGQYQFADSLPAEMKKRIDDTAGLKSVVVKPFGFPLMIMNSKSGPLADEKVRHAVATAISPQEMLLAAFGDPAFFSVEGSIYAPGTLYYDKASVVGYNVADTAKAAAELKATGYKGEPIRILTSTQYDFLYKMSLVAQAELQAAGFTVDLQVLDWATLMQKRGDQKVWDAFFTYHTFVPEPSLITFTNPSYPGWWDTPAKRAAFATFNSEMDPKARVAKWAEVQKLFYSEVPTIKVGDFYNLAARSDKLDGYRPMPWPFFWNVTLAK